MKFIIQLIIYFIITYITMLEEAVGQTTSKKYNYACTFNNMFGRGQNLKKYHATLRIEGEQSLFTMKADADNIQDSHLVMADLESDSIFTVFKDMESNSLLFQMNDLNQRPVYYADTLYPMHWNMTDDTMVILNVSCKKATTTFKGRFYTAWYADEIPIMNGPWKLGGLPGLIMEAYDDENNWHVQFVNEQKADPVHFEVYQKLMHGNAPSYSAYASEMKKIFKRASQYLASQKTGNCLTCQTKSTLKLHTWEWVD